MARRPTSEPATRRWAGAWLLAVAACLAGCTTPASDASPTSLGSGPTSTSVAAPTTSTAAFAPPPLAPSTTTVPALLQALDAVWWATPKSSCLMVQDGDTVLYERNPDLPVTPASTMKLLTATAVLLRIDPDSRLRTRIVGSSVPDASGTVTGDVYLVGGGDPLLATAPFARHFTRPRRHTPIESLADALRAAGVTRITGRLLGDDGRYDRERYLPSWPASYRVDHEAGPLSALLVNDGASSWTANRETPMADPAAGAADVVAQLLQERGIAVDGGVGAGTAPFAPVELAGIDSATIGEIVQTMLLDSNNNAAELLLRELGLQVVGQGTTAAGRQVVLDTLARLGLPMDGVTMADASGLDRGNRVTCRLLTALLTVSPVSLLVDAGLPVAARSGTLLRRFGGTPVAERLRAKTGSLRGVAALAGYAEGAAGRRLTFAYELEGVGWAQGDQLQEHLGLALVTTR
jgi:D-alanyl-D-alanine carboxypeptidase/D-alanyl-D-alanine-endopeptidase (penicillin-binding protein 4)